MESGRWYYIGHDDYAPDAVHYIRAFELLQSDLLRLFEFIEPADRNEDTFSFRCHELLLRACGEVEANCKAILEASGYGRTGDWNMKDYRLLEHSHHMSSYRVRLPVWTGANDVCRPFENWSQGESPAWFQAHHGGKHNRHSEFEKANFRNVVDAVSAVAALLTAQFLDVDFRPQSLGVSGFGPKGNFMKCIGDYFEVELPDDWADEDCYEFDWQKLKDTESPIQKLTFVAE